MNDWQTKEQKGFGFIFLLALAGALLISFSSVARAAETNNDLISSFGAGKTEVRVYTDYFCVPCRGAEPRMEALLRSLARKNLVNVTFIDAPFHKFSSLYAKYFLFILNENRSFERALSARAILFEAAKESMADPQRKEALSEAAKLEEYLKQKGVKYTAFDVKPVFTAFEQYLREDRIDATPTCVIERNGKKEIFKGGDDIAKALESLGSGRRLAEDKKSSPPKDSAK